MKVRPEKGQKLLLMSYSQTTKTAFSIEVECIASDPDGGTPARPIAHRQRCKVMVMLPGADARVIEVARGELEPASDYTGGA